MTTEAKTKGGGKASGGRDRGPVTKSAPQAAAAPCAEVSASLRLVDLRPAYSVGREPWMSPCPPVPTRMDFILNDKEAHTLRMVMDGFESAGVRCETGAEGVRLMLRAIRAAYETTIGG